jgi:predicted Zn finger-like uncharacterized protein
MKCPKCGSEVMIYAEHRPIDDKWRVVCEHCKHASEWYENHKEARKEFYRNKAR